MENELKAAQARIAELESTIDRLESQINRSIQANYDLRAELSAIKAQEPVAVLHQQHGFCWYEGKKPSPGTKLYAPPVVSAEQQGVADGWQLVRDQPPESGRTVLACYINRSGMNRTIRAQYVKAWTIEADDVADPDIECVEYSEQDDCYYLAQGWYECIDNLDEYCRVAVTEGQITHWMPLPAAPAPSTTEGQGDE
jgi:hypothetical protein